MVGERATKRGCRPAAGSFRPMFQFIISAVGEAANGSLERLSQWTLPVSGQVIDTLPDTDGEGWLYATLDAAAPYTVPAPAGTEEDARTVMVTDVLLRPHFLDEEPSPGMRSFPMDFAVVLDPAMRESGVIDLSRVDFIGVVEVDETPETPAGYDGGAVDYPMLDAAVDVAAEAASPDSDSDTDTVVGTEPQVVEDLARRHGTATAGHRLGLEVTPAAEDYRTVEKLAIRVDAPDYSPRGLADQAPPRVTAPVDDDHLAPLPDTYLANEGRRPSSRGRKTLLAAAAGATLLITLGVGLLGMGSRDSKPDAAPRVTPTTTTRTSTPVVPPPPPPPPSRESLNRVTTALPPGYPKGSCTPAADTEAGGFATLACGRNGDAGGPASGTYTGFSSPVSLAAAFDRAVAASSQRDCPGETPLQSPGPWRRNATPEKVAGTLFCGMRGQSPVVIWSNTERLTLSIVQGAPEVPDLPALYGWWTQHS